ncbi:MAG: hypothetical protein V3U76_14750 [Granulosicoccus sp.]
MNRRQLLLLTLLSVVTAPLWSQQLAVQTASVHPVNLNVDWNSAIREIPSTAYGVNSPANFIPEYSTDPVFMGNLELITQKKGFIRLHGWGMLDRESPEAWQENGIWNSAKIGQALRPLVEEGYTVMINIPSGPQGEEDYQDPEAYAQFCADLVKIVNIDHGLGIQYWEIPNEREAGFVDPGLSVSEMATLIETTAEAMKAVDPSIKVGGPATAWVNVDYIAQLVDAIYPNIDFLTAHTYSGDGSNSLQETFDIAQYATAALAELRTRIKSITGNTYLPIFLTEHNISFQGSPRIQSTKGAVYEAIILAESIKSGADASMYWAIAPYSDMSLLDGDSHSENAHVFEIFNQSFHGNLMQSHSEDSAKVIVYAASDPSSGTQAFGLINRTVHSQSIKLDFDGWQPDTLTWHLWDNDNDFSTAETNWHELNNGSFILSPYSVNLFINLDEHTPAAATLLNPSGNISNSTPTYSWNAAANTSWYYLWVKDHSGIKIRRWYTAAQAGCDSGTSDCSVTPVVQLDNGPGQWWIKTWNPAGYGPWSSPRSFNVNAPASPPSVAELQVPSGAINDTTPTYRWHAVANASWYYLWVDDSSGNRIKHWYTAAQAGCDDANGLCEVTPPNTLAAGNGRWWVLTWNSHGPGPWSRRLNFSIE